MGTCIICGAPCDGLVCELHEEDVVFEFEGSHPNQLTPNYYYRGTVDGYAEFGIFVDIGDSVTGLLHKSELDQRLESIDLEPGDTVYVQVQNVRDNGNVDLGWSIRQDKSRFRGALIHDPSGDEPHRLEDGDEEQAESSKKPTADDVSKTERSSDETTTETADDEPAGDEVSARDEESAEDTESETEQAEKEFESVTIDQLGDAVGQRVRLEGEIESARQTSGPTVFKLRDETGAVECAAFKEAGVRAYPDIGDGDVVRIQGEVERRRNELQVETEALVLLEEEEREAVTDRMQEALLQRARPGEFEPLVEDAAVEAVDEQIQDAATAIRRAVIEGRPVVVRHAATADGYVASSAIERATLPLVREEYGTADSEYHYFDRRPLDGSVYDMDDATKDVTTMLENRDRHGETLPLFVFVAAGGTAESIDGFDLLDTYDARRVVIDERAIEDGVADAVDMLVSPTLEGEFETTATVLGTTVAAQVNTDVRDDLSHLPAISFWEGAPDRYTELAADTGYDGEDTRKLREAVALKAFYQSYEDKRELISDLLFADEAEDPVGLAGHVSEQYRTRMDAEIETAEANVEEFDAGEETILVLDTQAYTHKYEFPSDPLLLEELYRRHREDGVALVGVGEDEAYIRSDADIDVREIAEVASEHAPGAALDVRGAREGRIEFLVGERDEAREAVLDALAGEFSSVATA